jgi:hypothetical protein
MRPAIKKALDEARAKLANPPAAKRTVDINRTRQRTATIEITQSLGWAKNYQVTTRIVIKCAIQQPMAVSTGHTLAKVDPLKALELSNAGLSLRRIAREHFPNASHVAVHRAIRFARKYSAPQTL